MEAVLRLIILTHCDMQMGGNIAKVEATRKEHVDKNFKPKWTLSTFVIK